MPLYNRNCISTFDIIYSLFAFDACYELPLMDVCSFMSPLLGVIKSKQILALIEFKLLTFAIPTALLNRWNLHIPTFLEVYIMSCLLCGCKRNSILNKTDCDISALLRVHSWLKSHHFLIAKL